MEDERLSESSSNIPLPIATPPLEGRDLKYIDPLTLVHDDDRESETTIQSTKAIQNIGHPSRNRSSGKAAIANTYHQEKSLSNYESSQYESSRAESDDTLSKEGESNHADRAPSRSQSITPTSEDPQIDFDAYGENTSLINEQISKFWMSFVPGSTRPRQKTQNYSFEMIVAAKAEDHYDRAQVLLDEGIPGAAIVLLNKSIMLHPSCCKYYRLRGSAYMEICDFKSAVANYKKVCAMEPDDKNSWDRLALMHYFLGQSLFDCKLHAEALEAFTRAAEICPQIESYHTRTLATLAALNRHSECLALINNRMEVNNDNPDLFIMRARIHDMFRNTSLCYYDVASALELDPDHEEANKMMRNIQFRANDLKKRAVEFKLAGKDKESLDKINSAIETFPASADFHLFSGALHRNRKDFNSAIDEYILAMDKTDHNEEDPIFIAANRELILTYNDFAVQCFHKGFYNEAIILLNKAIKVEKNEKGFYINRGDCFYRTGELHFALADFNQAMELDENDWSVRTRISVIHNEFAILEYYDRQYEAAVNRLTVAINNNPKIAQYYISRSRARYLVDDFNGARLDVLIALHLEPNSQNVITIMSRLFPGQSVNEILQSLEGRKALEQLKLNIMKAATPRQRLELPEIVPNKINKEEKEDDKLKTRDTIDQIQKLQIEDEVSAKDDNHLDLTPRARVGCFPNLQYCLEEKHFHADIIKSKKKIDNKVEKLLTSRPSLRSIEPKIKPVHHEIDVPNTGPIMPRIWEYGTANAVEAKNQPKSYMSKSIEHYS
ncbi:uncharacterized protein TRIADDRAFT_53326 [Trichoplax adhaerens]|uniref:Uncharacterized protein n=1 Tax=Trichoplax adhaerens TaxID=10228 RepID=B3RNX4_TRIAD|nr:hypothetical protein TRIADDRAFT_53326 [Trichoplax adhaerens]EDV27533.1 hypothetical protein TRIADDRAFT_53326 [Trichoplax adhaerens]|eukprot:XP_002109367.1 hypothetical protein TRIADDRAFT_53326 [Trichoplax adhaerens]